MSEIQESATPYILVSDDDGHHFLIPEQEQSSFDKWMEACQKGDYEDGMYYSYLNDYAIDLPKLKIYKYEINSN
jgi:hypothetical protein